MSQQLDNLVEHLLDEPIDPSLLAEPLPDAIAAAAIARLKQEADRHWWIDANRSLAFADRIIQIGEARNDPGEIALGMMARGDALKFLGRLTDAWTILDEAGAMFLAAGDSIGWARTRIGRMYISVDLEHVAEALADGERARTILIEHEAHELLLRLYINTALVHNALGDHHQALSFYHDVLAIADTLDEADTGQYLGAVYINMGYAYNFLGDFHEARRYYEQARAICEARGEAGAAAVAELNIAYIDQPQGHYRRALRRLHRAQAALEGQYPMHAASARSVMVECYLGLNRYSEAREMARHVVDELRKRDAAYEMACMLPYLATAEAELGNLNAAQAALEEAEAVFMSVGAQPWLGTIRLQRGRIALRQGDHDAAQREAQAAAAGFAAGSQQTNRAHAILLDGQARLAAGDWAGGRVAGQAALRIAQQRNIPGLRYSAHVLLGRVAEAQNDMRRAVRAYSAAAATVERMQRGLTITLRPGFLEDKGEALRALIRLHLAAGRVECAFDALERAKSQLWLGYLSNRETLRWSHDDPASQALVSELDALREEHQWYYNIAHSLAPLDGDRASAVDPQQALAELAVRERRMRSITEQLYLRNDGVHEQVALPALDDIQQALPDGALLVEFYNDGHHVWAFTQDRASVEVHPLPVTVETLDHLLAEFQFNIACALKVGPAAPATRSLTLLAQRIAGRLHDALLAPLADRLTGCERLVIVPYGALHYLPFHLLHDGSRYLVEQAEVVVLPAAGLVTRRAPQQLPGACVLAHSWNGRLPQTLAEGDQVRALFGGTIHADAAANRTAIPDVPGQILHVAAHGEHRIDQPDLSYIQLADGHLTTDDLLQHDLSYELVTLSACETGRANVAAGDELIGLGRGFLYAGAGALLASLWRVDDHWTITLMDHVYRSLRQGESKAAALRHAQQAILSEDSSLHPAFWGAFQLIGNADPLSSAGTGTA